MGLERYDIKILLALNQSIAGRKDFFRWLLDNGYPELAAFSNAIRGDVDAMKWLFANHNEWLAVLSNAIDGDDKARVWIGKACHPCNLMFALACREDIRARNPSFGKSRTLCAALRLVTYFDILNIL